MLLVIFGAGASFDSVPHLRPPVQADVEEDRPPLANELFGNRQEFVKAMGLFGECKPLIPRLRKDGVSVERELAIVQEQAKTYPPARQQLMAIRFYLQFALQECQLRWRNRHKGITSYATLISEIDRWRCEYDEQVCFVTFNYDTMLEDAMLQVLDFKTFDLNSYTSQRFYSIFKLHGSINWGHPIGVSGNPETYGYKKIIKEASDIKVYPEYVTNSNFTGTNCLIPALSIPLEQKDQFSCPEAHVKKLEEALASVTKVLIIGWRATEAEFVSMLHANLNANVGLMIVSGNRAGGDETVKNLDPSGVHYSNQNCLDFGFTGLIQNLAVLDYLLRTKTF